MRILVIEDEPRILDFVSRGLEAEGFSVVGARDGQEGLRAAQNVRCDLVILDLLLPKLDGLSVLRALEAKHPEVPVVIVSARADLTTKLNGFGLGARDYLTKPFSFDELLARIRVHLRRPEETSNNGHVLRAGALALDLARRQAQLGDQRIDLSDREFKLLHSLLECAGEVVSRERLLSEVWGYHFDPRSNVVDVCIRRLRKKLGPGSPIETVRHAGYRLAQA
ncbi:MAG: response regulator transcription factor [Actinobacteria bacterium]|nr:MAG: response regulator transcription factor [Actinomycetota bacterium]